MTDGAYHVPGYGSGHVGWLVPGHDRKLTSTRHDATHLAFVASGIERVILWTPEQIDRLLWDALDHHPHESADVARAMTDAELAVAYDAAHDTAVNTARRCGEFYARLASPDRPGAVLVWRGEEPARYVSSAAIDREAERCPALDERVLARTADARRKAFESLHDITRASLLRAALSGDDLAGLLRAGDRSDRVIGHVGWASTIAAGQRGSGISPDRHGAACLALDPSDVSMERVRWTIEEVITMSTQDEKTTSYAPSLSETQCAAWRSLPQSARDLAVEYATREDTRDLPTKVEGIYVGFCVDRGDASVYQSGNHERVVIGAQGEGQTVGDRRWSPAQVMKFAHDDQVAAASDGPTREASAKTGELTPAQEAKILDELPLEVLARAAWCAHPPDEWTEAEPPAHGSWSIWLVGKDGTVHISGGVLNHNFLTHHVMAAWTRRKFAQAWAPDRILSTMPDEVASGELPEELTRWIGTPYLSEAHRLDTLPRGALARFAWHATPRSAWTRAEPVTVPDVEFGDADEGRVAMRINDTRMTYIFTRHDVLAAWHRFTHPSTTETTMTNKADKLTPDTTPGVIATLKTDATEAAWRTSGKQFTRLARDPIAALLARHLGPDDESMRARVSEFLKTEIGTAMLASLLSVGLGAMPDAAGAVPQRLARELRVSAMADAGDVLSEVLLAPMRDVLATTLRGVPEIAVAQGLGDGARPRSAHVVDLGEKAEAKRGA